MDWKFQADERGVTLHDHEITAWSFGEDITMIFEDRYDVFSNCPQNGTGRHQQTKSSAVILKNGRFISGLISLENNDRAITREELLQLDLEVLDFRRLPDSVIISCDAWSRDTHKDAGFCELEFSCTDVLFCWNEFSGDAWFQK